jgi:hypothetical protein
MALSDDMLDTSLNAALAAIEIYNKPDFKYREQVFTILCVNAWELLLKAKLVSDAGEDVTTLYVPLKTGGYKTNRSKNPLTIDITAAMNRLTLDAAIAGNLNALIDIRDTAVHFFHSQSLSYLIFTLGLAALKNYQRLMSDWFNRSLLNYNFYILPLAFAYNFKTLSHIDIENEPEVIANILKSVSGTQATVDQSSGFFFACEIATEVKAAKSYSGTADLVAVFDPNAADGSAVFVQTQRLIDKYPISYKELIRRVQEARPGVNANMINAFMKQHNVRGDSRYSAYNFRNKEQERVFASTGIAASSATCIYNEDAVNLLINGIT